MKFTITTTCIITFIFLALCNSTAQETANNGEGKRSVNELKLLSKRKARRLKELTVNGFQTTITTARRRTYTSKRGGSKCTAGQRRKEGSAWQCKSCNLGRFQPTDNVDEIYQDTGSGLQLVGNRCLNCPTGYFVAKEKAVECEACPIGWYSDAIGSGECTECTASKYVGTTASPICLDCPKGFAQPNARRGDCEQCIAGKFGDETGRTDASNCVDCAEGKWQADIGATSCDNCPAGKFADQPGTNNNGCKKCGKGTYQNEDGTGGSSPNIACKICPKGKYNNVAESALIVCHNCKRFHYADDVGWENCEKCPIGFTSYFEAGEDCIGCPVSCSFFLSVCLFFVVVDVSFLNYYNGY